MINHFHTLLLNKNSSFYSSSLFPIFADAQYEEYLNENIHDQLDRILFGGAYDPSLMDYRFLLFLRLIKSVNLYDHVLRFDPRETYLLDQYNLSDPTVFSTRVSPENSVIIQDIEMNNDSDTVFMRKLLHVSKQNSEIRVFDRQSQSDVSHLPQSDGGILIPSMHIGIGQIPENTSIDIDYRVQDKKPVSEIINETLSLSSNEYFDLFRPLRDTYPEYEDGFRHVTDNIYRFCMVLFAKAAFGMLATR